MVRLKSEFFYCFTSTYCLFYLLSLIHSLSGWEGHFLRRKFWIYRDFKNHRKFFIKWSPNHAISGEIFDWLKCNKRLGNGLIWDLISLTGLCCFLLSCTLSCFMNCNNHFRELIICDTWFACIRSWVADQFDLKDINETGQSLENSDLRSTKDRRENFWPRPSLSTFGDRELTFSDLVMNYVYCFYFSQGSSFAICTDPNNLYFKIFWKTFVKSIFQFFVCFTTTLTSPLAPSIPELKYCSSHIIYITV